MKLVDQYYQFPHQCYFTNSSSVEKPILDTGQHVEGEGRVYMSGAMWEEACRLLGWVPPEELELITADRDSLAAQVAELTAKVERQGDMEAAILEAAESIKGARDKVVAAAQDIHRAPSAFQQNPKHPLYGG